MASKTDYLKYVRQFSVKPSHSKATPACKLKSDDIPTVEPSPTDPDMLGVELLSSSESEDAHSIVSIPSSSEDAGPTKPTSSDSGISGGGCQPNHKLSPASKIPRTSSWVLSLLGAERAGTIERTIERMC